MYLKLKKKNFKKFRVSLYKYSLMRKRENIKKKKKDRDALLSCLYIEVSCILL